MSGQYYYHLKACKDRLLLAALSSDEGKMKEMPDEEMEFPMQNDTLLGETSRSL